MKQEAEPATERATEPAAAGTRLVGVLAIHGMGNPRPDFATPLLTRLAAALGADAHDVAMEPCFWSDLLAAQQEVVWQRVLGSGHPLRWRALRAWVVRALGDPAGYLSSYIRADGRHESAYHAIHERLRERLAVLAGRLHAPDAPLVVLAHSLGGVIVSNYAWDQQHPRPPAPTALAEPGARPFAERVHGHAAFERMETLTALVTYGCNLPLFLPPVSPLRSIAFPPPGLPPRLRAAARWLNLYDPDDALGWPIADVWDEPPAQPIEDVAIEVGGFVEGWTPLAHARYDESAAFVARVAEVVRGVVAAERGRVG